MSMVHGRAKRDGGMNRVHWGGWRYGEGVMSYHVAHLGSEDLGVGLLLQVLLERLLRVQAEALAYSKTET
jgi:hypothetical protein